MAEIILFEFSKVLLARLTPLLVDEVRLQLGVEDELAKLNTNLSAIKAVLQDAEKQQNLQSVRDWLQNLEDLVYDIDDLFDEIAIETSEREKSKHSCFKQVSRFLSCSNPQLFQSLLARKIRDISERLDAVAYAGANFRFHSESVDVKEGRETHSRLPKSEILGRDEDKKKIIDIVLSCGKCDESLSVVPIVGFGGVGKTTLAKLIFNDPLIQSSFNEKIWVYASENFSEKKILEQIVRAICKENKAISVQEMQIMLGAELKKNKFFLILDDLWNVNPNTWRNLRD